MPSLPFFLSNSSSEGIGVPEADIPRWSGMIMGAQFAAIACSEACSLAGWGTSTAMLAR